MSAGAGAIFSTAGNMLTSMINNMWASQMASEDRAENYRYGEMAANAADRRTRALYNDFYSPQALLRQYQAAGLSPSLMFGGTPGQGGASGAQGSGAAGIQTHFAPMSLVDAAQAAALFAQAENTKADTKKKEAETTNVNTDTELKNLQGDLLELQKKFAKRENEKEDAIYTLTTSFVYNENGEMKSMYNVAEQSNNYDEFIKELNKDADRSNNTKFKQIVNSELGNQILRSIYVESKSLQKEINILSSTEVSAEFQASLVKALQNLDYANINAETIVEALKAQAEVSKLTGAQKSAWNRFIDRLGRGRWWTDALVGIFSLVGNFCGSNKVNISTGENTFNIQKNSN